MNIIDRHFPESGIVKMIHEYSVEYDPLDLEEFFHDGDNCRGGNGTIFFNSGMNVLTIDYCADDRRICFNVRHGSFSILDCEPNEVVHKLVTLSPQEIQALVEHDVVHDDMVTILCALIEIAENLESNLVLKCNSRVLVGSNTWADRVLAGSE